MSEHERIQALNRRLNELEQRTVTSWERPILEVAQLAILQEIATLGRRIARWKSRICEPNLDRASRSRRPAHLLVRVTG